MKKNFLDLKINISNKNQYEDNSFYILSSQSCFISKKQLDSCLNTIRFFIKRQKKQKKFISLLQFNIPVTKKNRASRMGSGKGKIKKFLAKVYMNGILFIFKNISKFLMLKIYKYIQYKLPMKIFLKY